MKNLLIYLLLGLAAGLLLFFFTQRIATNLKASIETYQEQGLLQLEEQMEWEYENVNKRLIEQEEAYQYQLYLIESYADIIDETEADYLEMMGRHSPHYKEYLTQLCGQFPHVTPIELWDLIYEKEKDFLNRHGRVSQRIIDKLGDSKERAQDIQDLFGDLKEQMR